LVGFEKSKDLPILVRCIHCANHRYTSLAGHECLVGLKKIREIGEFYPPKGSITVLSRHRCSGFIPVEPVEYVERGSGSDRYLMALPKG